MITLIGALCAGILACTLSYYLLEPIFRRDLRSIPGPIFAIISNIPRLLIAKSRKQNEIHLKLQRKYGNLVRVGPNCVLINDPTCIPLIYGSNKTAFPKSNFYTTWDRYMHGRRVPNMFSVVDDQLHQTLRRPVAHLYTKNVINEFEPFVDSTINVLFQKLKTNYANQKDRPTCNIGTWIHWYAFDVIGELTFSKRFGFLEEETDVKNMISQGHKRSDYDFVVGQMPWLDTLLEKNKLAALLKTPKATFTVTFIKDQMAAKNQEKPSALMDRPQDFTDRFIEVANTKGLSQQFVITWAAANIAAGTHSTATAIRSTLYYLIQNPSALARLREEIHAANLDETPFISYDEAKKLPYLDSCIRESLRLNPPVGCGLERVVPEGGLEVDGKFIRQGTIVAVNPWVVQKNEETFGERVDEWRPERWLNVSPERKKLMDRALFVFGGGPRNCIGKNIALLQLYKIIPMLVRDFELELVSPDKPLRTTCSLFVRQEGFEVWLKERTIGRSGISEGIAAAAA